MTEIYAYNAALWCGDCAVKIIADLDAKGVEDTGETDDYPQGPYDAECDEADCPQHCDGCQEFLENSLTSDGQAYVLEAIRKAGEDAPYANSRAVLAANEDRVKARDYSVLRQWFEFYSNDLDYKQVKACFPIYLRNSDDDPTQIYADVMHPLAEQWADYDSSIEGSSWEVCDGTLAYAIIMWHPTLIADLEAEGYTLDCSGYSDCDDDDIRIATYARENEMEYRDAEVELAEETTP